MRQVRGVQRLVGADSVDLPVSVTTAMDPGKPEVNALLNLGIVAARGRRDRKPHTRSSMTA